MARNRSIHIGPAMTLALAVALVGCGGAKKPAIEAKPPPVPVSPVVAPVPVPVAPAGDWAERAVEPGGWTYRALGSRGSAADFGRADMPVDLAIQCDRATRRIHFNRPVPRALDRSAMLTLRTSEAVTRHPLTQASDAAASPVMRASLDATDSTLDRLVYSRGRFMVQVEGAHDLILPLWGDVQRVIEDCRA